MLRRPGAHVWQTKEKKVAEPKRRGFSAMDKEKQREIASKGGKAAHQKGTAHEFTAEEAREAGRKGGATARARQKTPSEPQEQSKSENEPNSAHPQPPRE